MQAAVEVHWEMVMNGTSEALGADLVRRDRHITLDENQIVIRVAYADANQNRRMIGMEVNHKAIRSQADALQLGATWT